MSSTNPYQSTRNQQQRNFDSYNRENSTGFKSVDVDLYSILDVPQDSSIKQIEKQFRKISLHFHPDKQKLNQPENIEGILESNLQIFNEVKKAYGYLSNTITKLIYDQYGIPGLIMYDKHSDNFDGLLREMIELNSMPEICKDTLFEENKREIEYQILRKSHNYLKAQVKNQVGNQFQKSFSMDLGVSAKSFCNYYQQFYFANQTSQIFKLLKYKSFISAFNTSLAWPNSQGKRIHATQLNLTTQNDLNKGLGTNIFRIIQHYNHSDTFNVKTRLTFKEKERGLGFDFQKGFFNRELFAKLSFGVIIPKGIEPPSISFSSSQMKPYQINCAGNVGGGFSVSVDKPVPSDGTSNFGYSGHLNMSPNDVGAGFGFQYDVNDNVSINSKLGVTLEGSIDHSIDVSYSFSQLYRAGVRFEREFKDLGEELNHSLVTLEYQHQNYAFKMPIYCYNQAQNMAGLVMTSALFCVANGLALYSQKKYQEKKDLNKNKDLVVFFSNFQTKLHKSEQYIKKFQLYYNKSLNNERTNRGLEIKEAYFGLSDHIRHIDAGIITYSIPQTVKEYNQCQVIPVAKQLQILVENSQIELSVDILHKKKKKKENEDKNQDEDMEDGLTNGIFIPCVNRRAKVLLYVRFVFKGIEKVIIYDHRATPKMVIPYDYMQM